MRHKGGIICLAILGLLIITLLLGLTQGWTASPPQAFFMLGLLIFFVFLFIVILCVLLVKAI